GPHALHGRAGLGVAVDTQQARDPMGFDISSSSFTRAYPAVELGGGLHLGRVRFQLGLLISPAPSDGAPDLGTRFMATFAIDLWRKPEPQAQASPATTPLPGQPGAPTPDAQPQPASEPDASAPPTP